MGQPPAFEDSSASVIGIGTMSGVPDDVTDARLESLIGYALAKGVRVFDTAPDYRFGKAEEVLGRSLLKGFSDGVANRDDVVVVTKEGL